MERKKKEIKEIKIKKNLNKWLLKEKKKEKKENNREK